MSNVANLELCKELHELSGWNDTLLRHFTGETYNFDSKLVVNTVYDKIVSVSDERVGCDECEGFYANDNETVPAYDLAIELFKQKVLTK